jgi:signal transduction histidine kinase
VAELRARLLQEEHKRARIQEIGAALGSTLDLDRLLVLIMDRVTELLQADRSTLYLVSDDGLQLWSKIAQGREVREIRLRVGEGVAGWVARSGERVNIADAYQDPRFQQDYDRKTGYHTQSILALPVVTSIGKLVGVVQALNKRGGPFSSEDEALLATIAGQAALSIENSKLYQSVVAKNTELVATQDKLRQAVAELDLLFEVEQQMHESEGSSEMLDRLLVRAMELVGAEAGSILLREPKTDDLYFRLARGERGPELLRLRVPLDQGIVGWVVTERQPLIVNRPVEDARFNVAFAERVGFMPRNILCAPLLSDGATLGAIELLNKAAGERFTPEDLRIVTLIGGQASRAIQLSREREERDKQSRLAAIGQMMSGMLHDLRTPMTIASGYAQLMAQSAELPQREQYVDMILRQFDMMSAMTREVLEFARGESNLLVRKVFLPKYLEQIREYLELEFSGKNVTFELLPEYTGAAYFDEIKILRVIQNMARNAAQALAGRVGARFRFRIAATADRLLLEFMDNGPGIPPEIEGRLYEPFATSGKKDGTGLGLAVVKKIVDEHAGSIHHQSRADQGTTFEIFLPLHRAARAPEHA